MRKKLRALGDYKARRAAGLTVDRPSRRRRARLRCSAPLSELQVHLTVVAHLRHRATRGTWWFHPANGEIRDGRTAAKLKSMGVKAGTPDLLLLRRGQMFALELKRPGGRLSSAQSWSAKALFGVVPTDEGPCLAVGAVFRQLQEGPLFAFDSEVALYRHEDDSWHHRDITEFDTTGTVLLWQATEPTRSD